MTTSIQPTPGVSDTTLQTAAAAHAIMVALHSRLTAVGLTLESFTGSYDPTGADTQMPSTGGGVSPWMAFNFSDSYQSSFPITFWVAFDYVYALDAGTHTFVPRYRLSEGLDAGGNPLGEIVLFNPTNGSAGSGAGFRLYLTATKGDYVRYSGDTLTLLYGIDGTTNVNYNSVRASLAEIHIERVRDAVSGDVTSGYAALFSPYNIGSPSTNFAGWPASYYVLSPSQFPNPAFTNNVAAGNVISTTNASRAGGKAFQYQNTVPVVMPVYYYDNNGIPNTFRKMFTVPKGGMSLLDTPVLDFLGVEQKYLAYWTSGRDFHVTEGLAFLFEWE